MQHEAMMTSLKAIKLYGMAQAVDELARQGSPAYKSAQGMLGTLLKAEMAEREVRSISYPRWVVTTIARLLFISIGQPPISAQGIKHRKQDAADTTPALFLFLCGYSAKLPTFDQIFLKRCSTISLCVRVVVLFINRKGEILGKRKSSERRTQKEI